MKRKTMIPVAIVLLVILDQLVKWYVVKNIPLGVVKSFVPHVVSLTYLQNTGAAFSLLEMVLYPYHSCRDGGGLLLSL